MSDCYQVCANCGYANPIRDRAVATCDQCRVGLGKQLVSVTFTCSVCDKCLIAATESIGIVGAMKMAEDDGWEFEPVWGRMPHDARPKTYCPKCRARKAESNEQ